MISRRHFLHTGLLATAGLSLWSRDEASAFDAQGDVPLSFDLHTHPGGFQGGTGVSADSLRGTTSGMKRGRLSGAFFSLVADAPLLLRTPTGIKVRGAYAPGEAAAEYTRQIRFLKQQLAGTSDLAFVATRADDLKRAHKTGKVAAFIGCEGGEFLDGDADKVDMLYADGIRSLQLVHYVPSALGDLQTQPAQHNGLSPLGKAVVKRCNSKRVLIDVAHASMATVRDVITLSTAPVILSHSILSMDGNRLLAARSISVDHAKLVASTGGVIGAWPSGFNKSFDEFVDNTKRLIDVVGVDHVGLGTDMDGNLEPVFNDYQQLAAWGAALQQRGLSKSEAEKVLGGNMLRVLQTAIG